RALPYRHRHQIDVAPLYRYRVLTRGVAMAQRDAELNTCQSGGPAEPDIRAPDLPLARTRSRHATSDITRACFASLIRVRATTAPAAKTTMIGAVRVPTARR